MLKDASVFFLASVGFLVAGIVAEIVNRYVKYTGPGFSPVEVMGTFMFTAAAVLFVLSAVKLVLAGWDV